ncbi:hypothetical protein DFR44_10930 [Hydromonas duriensis]|uniref:Uncharacterized protein n=1 Tax=Hydromonas duriensis TaxID=1527608 RepID=A0A4R6Y831_9BURK|nr:hypothetical protein DFR44_10930 [Hydromonas duriensis]
MVLENKVRLIRHLIVLALLSMISLMSQAHDQDVDNLSADIALIRNLDNTPIKFYSNTFVSTLAIS